MLIVRILMLLPILGVTRQYNTHVTEVYGIVENNKLNNKETNNTTL